MTSIIVCGLLLMGLLAALLAALTRDLEKLLWGSLLCSLGLGVAVLVSSKGYFGILVLSTFLLTDLLLYLYFRSLGVSPKKKIQSPNLNRLGRVFLVWMAMCGFLVAAFALHDYIQLNPVELFKSNPVDLLQAAAWGPNWYLVILSSLVLPIISVGGFFLVRRERR